MVKTMKEDLIGKGMPGTRKRCQRVPVLLNGLKKNNNFITKSRKNVEIMVR
jgi:hypothetical protein